MAKRGKKTRHIPPKTGSNGTAYELRALGLGHGQVKLEVWQLPTPATPRLGAPELTASLKGRVLEIVEIRVLKQLQAAGIRLPDLKKGADRTYDLNEDLALNLALLFRTLAPMRSIDRIRMVSTGIDEMTREEAGYWLGMAIHRSRPRRVLAALRMLLTST